MFQSMKSIPKTYDLFISYGRGDVDDFVGRLYENLVESGYNVWYDRVSIESNGLSFLQSIRDALFENPIRLILIISPHSVESPFVRAEWEFALENCLVVIPVLRTGTEREEKGDAAFADDDYTLIPEPLQRRRLHCIDFRRKRQYSDALSELLNSLANAPKNLALLHGVLNKPNNYIARVSEIETIKESLLKDSLYPTVVTSTAKATTVQGMGGIGKTVIAAALCHDCDIRRSFGDGIYWITIGQNPDIEKALQFITGDNNINFLDNPEEAKRKLELFQKEKNCLIVLDDVWKQEHIEIFASDVVLRSRLLITTRNKQAVKHLSEHCFTVGLLSDEDALLLLARATNKKIEELPDGATKIVKECAHLPLAISMIGGMIKAGDETTWEHALTMLQEADLDVIAQKFPDYPYPDLFRAIDVSIQSLKEEGRNKYLQLAIFKEDARIPEEMINVLWKSKNWKKYNTHVLINEFVERSILQRVDNGVYELHDLQYDYIQKTVHNLKGYHQLFIKNLGNPLALSHPYAWNNYIWHLTEAGKVKTATALLKNFDWIDAKFTACNIYDLLQDYQHCSLDSDAILIYRALKLSAHVLSEDKGQLPAQLIGRLQYITNKTVIQFVQNAGEWKKRPWIKPLRSSLTAPSEQLRSVLKGHTDSVTILKTHGNKIISGSYDATLRIWDIESGMCTKTLIGHTNALEDVLVHQNKIISTSYDSTIVWELESGKCLHKLEGHTTSLQIYGNKIISGSSDSVRVWDIDTGHCVWAYSMDEAAIYITCDNKIVISSEDSSFRIWEIASGQCIQSFYGHSDAINVFIIHNNKIISGSKDATVRIWDIESGRCLQELKGHSSGVTELLVHDNKIVSRARDTIRIWDMMSGQCLSEILNTSWEIITYGNKLITVQQSLHSGEYGEYPDIFIWNIDTGECTHKLEGDTIGIRHINYRIINENRIYSWSDHRDRRRTDIRVWDIESGECIQTIPRGDCEHFLFHKKKIITVFDLSIQIWDIESCEFKQSLKGHIERITSLLIHDNQIISGSQDKTIRIWDIDPDPGIKISDVNTDRITSLLLHNNRIFTGSNDGTVYILEIETGSCIPYLTVKRIREITPIAGYEDKIITLSRDYIHIWEIESGECIQTIEINEEIDEERDASLLFVHNDKIIYALHSIFEPRRPTICISDVVSGECIQTLKGHAARITALLFYEDKIISSSDDRTIRIWDIQSGECLSILQGHTDKICSLLIYNNQLISGSYDKTIRIWDIQTGECLQTLTGNISEYATLLLVHENKIINASNNYIKVWDINSGKCLQTFEGLTKNISHLFIHNDKLFGWSYDDKDIMIWDVKSWKCLKILQGHKDPIFSVLASGNKLISTDRAGLLIIHELKGFTELCRYTSDTELRLKFIHNNTIILDGGKLNILKIEDLQT